MKRLSAARAPFYPAKVPPDANDIRELRAMGGSIQEAHAMMEYHPGASTRLVVATQLLAGMLASVPSMDSLGDRGEGLAKRAVVLADQLIAEAER